MRPRLRLGRAPAPLRGRHPDRERRGSGGPPHPPAEAPGSLVKARAAAGGVGQVLNTGTIASELPFQLSRADNRLTSGPR
jgi:hypothetical protein